MESLLLPAPNLNGGNWLSGLFLDGIELVEYPFARESDGRSSTDFFLLRHGQYVPQAEQMARLTPEVLVPLQTLAWAETMA